MRYENVDDDSPLAELERAWQDGSLRDDVESDVRKAADSVRWNTRHPIHTPLLVEAFAFGVLSADFWFANYRAPEGLELMVNWIAFNVQREFPDAFAELSLREVEERYLAWMRDCPVIRDWNPDPARNDTPRRLYLVLRNAGEGTMMPSRPFLALDAVVRNAAALVGDWWEVRHRMQQRLHERMRARQLPAGW